MDCALCLVEPCGCERGATTFGLSQGAEETVTGTRISAAQGIRRIRSAGLCGYRTARGAIAGDSGRAWLDGEEHVSHPSQAWVLRIFGSTAESLETDQKSKTLEVPDRCGSCRRCIEACPTDALIAPYQMDAAKCIAYLTIEHKGPIAPELMEDMGRQVFGCDICQDVCPWNRKAPISFDTELEPRTELVNPALEGLAAMDEQAFERTLNGSPVRRAGFAGLQRNTAIAMANSGAREFAPRLREWASAADEGLRAAAQWGLKKLNL